MTRHLAKAVSGRRVCPGQQGGMAHDGREDMADGHMVAAAVREQRRNQLEIKFIQLSLMGHMPHSNHDTSFSVLVSHAYSWQ